MQLLMVTEAVIRVHTVGKHIVGQGRGSAAACSEDKREKRLHLVLDFFDSPKVAAFFSCKGWRRGGEHKEAEATYPSNLNTVHVWFSHCPMARLLLT
jgi:hypothetical protein